MDESQDAIDRLGVEWELVGIWLLVNFVFEVWEHLPVRAEEARWQAALAREEERHAALSQRLEYVATDAYVEREARERFRMVKPGEYLVRPIWIGQSDRSDGGDLAVEAIATWQLWWDRFFGGP